MKLIHYQKLLLSVFSKIKEGQLVIQLPEGVHHFFGSESSEQTQPIHLIVHDNEFFKRVVIQEDIGLGESYIAQQWNCNDLAGFLKLLVRNHRYLSGNSSKFVVSLLKKILIGWDRLGHIARSNTRQNSRRNIHEHYDLGNSFYAQFLDPSMTYSSGIFTDFSDDLESAQFEKYDRLCRKLALKPGLHLLEIGSGWGGMALHAATHYGVRVTTVTISEEQYDYVKNLIKLRGLEERIEVRFQDYRDIEGKFDRIVSIEMLEAVGHEHLNHYFKTCSRLLEPSGIFAFQVILSPDSRYRDYRNRVDFIRKHIFPGGHLPSFKSIHESVNRNSDWDLLHMETFGTHYAETLRRWDQQFTRSTAKRHRLGFDETFDRKWEFYFAYCEAGFDTRHIQVAQFVYAAPNNLEYNYEKSVESAEQSIRAYDDRRRHSQ